ncbi:hypothetical protein M9H77_13266 [Catharanthus roseus]|uniref:Uncharacterized protein n=1 Tax=Catharanthus roseus TaxID=4058 RepID=A0ACC0BJY5_CATRO|nr:hypothetical protein M9H77_13266 [Catharanthus roseus]
MSPPPLDSDDDPKAPLLPDLCFAQVLVKFDNDDHGWPAEAKTSSRNMLAVLAWIFSWWLTEAVPMPITSMSPLFLFPMFGISSADDVAHSYMDDVISLVLGTFILALAIENYNIHRRLALNVSLTQFPFKIFFLMYIGWRNVVQTYIYLLI